jgi:glycosyltransferase involved in cell wall biosynthesis
MRYANTHITVIAPCYNEQEVIIPFLHLLQQAVQPLAYAFCIVVVNDHSTDDTLALLKDFRFTAGNITLNTINLRYNVGHQAAIYQGLLYAQTLPCDHFIVMDADGEDNPAAIARLLEEKDADIVHVVRSKRKESSLFRLGYGIYMGLFMLATGKQMNIGNYSLISRSVLEKAVKNSFAHFAAFRSRQKGVIRYVEVEKEVRLGGRSKMGYRKLMVHAARSFIEYGEELPALFSKSIIRLFALLNDRNKVRQPIYEKVIHDKSVQP